jgi:hypothetical protein
MKEYQLFLRLLSERVYTAEPRLLDATDFHAWLFKCSELAGSCATVQEFFDRL